MPEHTTSQKTRQQRMPYEMFADRLRSAGMFGDAIRLEQTYGPIGDETISYAILISDENNMLLEVCLEYSKPGASEPRINTIPRSFFTAFSAPKFNVHRTERKGGV